MGFLIFIVIGFILWGITSFGIDKLDSKVAWFSFLKKGIFWLIITPLWMLYALIALAGFINNTDMIDENFLDKKTVYFTYCSDFTHDIFSCPDGEKIFTKKVFFKVSFENQIVVEDSGTTYKYSKCSVFDANNWNCEDESKKFNVQNGRYFEYSKNNLYTNPIIDKEGKPSSFSLYFSVDKSDYLIREIIQFFRSF